MQNRESCVWVDVLAMSFITNESSIKDMVVLGRLTDVPYFLVNKMQKHRPRLYLGYTGAIIGSIHYTYHSPSTSLPR